MGAQLPPIVQWQAIQNRYRDGLIVGNGGSAAVDRRFLYGSLYDAARQRNHLQPPVQEIFDRFGTQDFELVLRRLWQATLVNQALEIEAGRVEQAYTQVRTALIATIRDVHVNYEEALRHLTPIYQFLQHFRTVMSLNYDLIIYWAAMLGNEQLGNWFKDGFSPTVFNADWRRLREPYGAAGATLFFYPHGNLALARNAQGNEVKIVTDAGRDLLGTILDRWMAASAIPLFVCEGTSAHKRRAIGTSRYLQLVANEPMHELGESIVIFGWAMGEQEAHILEQLRANRPDRIAVSVHNEDFAFVEHAERRLRGIGATELVFFDSDSPGCWNSPA